MGEFRQENGEMVEVALPRQKYAQLEVKTGSLVHLEPRRAPLAVADLDAKEAEPARAA